MKILWLCTNQNPNFGGLELHSISFVNALKNRFDIALCISKNNFVDKNTNGFKKYYTTTRYSFDLKALRDLYKYAKDFNPDIIVCNNAKEYEISLIISKILKKKIVAFRHMENLKNPLVAKFILSNMNIIYTVSQQLKDEIVLKGVNPSKVKVLYNPIKQGKPEKTYEERIRILFVGKIIKAKGIWEFIYMAKELLKKDKHFHFTVVGDGEDLPMIKDFVKNHKLEEFFAFTGFQKDTYYYYQNADIVCVLSKHDEAISRVAIEALANACVVIGSNVGGIKETIDNRVNGMLVNVEDIEALKNAVLFFKDKEFLKKAQKHSYNLYKEKFSEEIILKAFEKDMHETLITKTIENQI